MKNESRIRGLMQNILHMAPKLYAQNQELRILLQDENSSEQGNN